MAFLEGLAFLVFSWPMLLFSVSVALLVLAVVALGLTMLG
jgi:hypothetical protein